MLTKEENIIAIKELFSIRYDINEDEFDEIIKDRKIDINGIISLIHSGRITSDILIKSSGSKNVILSKLLLFICKYAKTVYEIDSNDYEIFSKNYYEVYQSLCLDLKCGKYFDESLLFLLYGFKIQNDNTDLDYFEQHEILMDMLKDSKEEFNIDTDGEKITVPYNMLSRDQRKCYQISDIVSNMMIVSSLRLNEKPA